MLEGTGTLDVAGTAVELREGHAVFVPAGAEHRFSGYEQLSVLVIFERPEAVTSPTSIELLDAYWRAANYLSVGQIYLLDNPLLREPLRARARQAAAARPLGHDARPQSRLRAPEPRDPRARPRRDLRGRARARRPRPGRERLPRGHVHASSTRTCRATRPACTALFRQFSFPGGIPSHVAPETPGSIHEGGELGYALAHAFGAAFDNPDLLVACVVGDGEAETGPLATSWHANKFLNPAPTAPCCRSCT